MIHIVKKPFYCRKDQFASAGFSGQVLVIGISMEALKTHNPYRFKIGNNPTVYSANSDIVLAIGQQWINKKNKTVIIIPVSLFQKEK